ncbi:hypothetical protein BS47DRAFT_1005868 [Hydnum rufescens UP504]|uniref:ATP-dependent DNA helicase n=1 Tax=Hydnum rufescens UP504 TaxID=1448309 RepID=A0A9P6B8Y0_9AGAM|nr:hypothetical protein BS47DRAFT_1005868 [Hydnum rufescens UP504]
MDDPSFSRDLQAPGNLSFFVRLRENSISRQSVAVTASTGIAGVNIGGGTLHSFAGIGLGKEPAEVLAKKIEKNRNTADRWRGTTALIIDEISMVDGKLFDKLEYIARVLPPVPDRHDGAEIPAEYAFDARTWNKCVKKHVMLTKVFRQTDTRFINVLNEMRLGNMSAKSIQIFKALSRPVLYRDDLDPAELSVIFVPDVRFATVTYLVRYRYPTRNQVDAANWIRLNQLPLPEQEFFAADFPGYDIRGQPIPPAKAKELLDRLVAQDKLSLRVGAQVMLIQNMKQGHLVNGSMGTVVAFDTAENAVRQMVDIAKVDERTARNAARPMHAQGKDESTPEKLVPKNRMWPIVEFENGMKLMHVTMPVILSVPRSDFLLLIFLVVSKPSVIRYLLSYRGHFPYTRARAKPWNELRWIWGKCSKRVKPTLPSPEPRAWNHCKFSISNLAEFGQTHESLNSTTVWASMILAMVTGRRVPTSSTFLYEEI